MDLAISVIRHGICIHIPFDMPRNVRYDHIIFGAGEGERIEVSERCMIEDYAQNGEILELE